MHAGVGVVLNKHVLTSFRDLKRPSPGPFFQTPPMAVSAFASTDQYPMCSTHNITGSKMWVWRLMELVIRVVQEQVTQYCHATSTTFMTTCEKAKILGSAMRLYGVYMEFLLSPKLCHEVKLWS